MSQLDFLHVLFRERDIIHICTEEMTQLSTALRIAGNPIVAKNIEAAVSSINQAIDTIYDAHGDAIRKDMADIQRATAENFKAILNGGKYEDPSS